MRSFKPQHLNALKEDLMGNGKIGRYILLTGSDQRAHEISEYFSDLRIKSHPRQHNLYLGKLSFFDQTIDIAAISSGMGGPSADIIINELFALGARRIVRVGTAGSLQPETVKVGDVVIASAAVRDDKASWDYIYKEYPATASFEWLIAANRVAGQLSAEIKTHNGVVHTKSSLYAREMGQSFLQENKTYMETMHLAGVLASEMESAQLFILASLLNARLKKEAADNIPAVVGAMLAIVGDNTPFSSNEQLISKAINSVIMLSIETVKELSYIDRQGIGLYTART